MTVLGSSIAAIIPPPKKKNKTEKTAVFFVYSVDLV